jgi:hypothetical protein
MLSVTRVELDLHCCVTAACKLAFCLKVLTRSRNSFDATEFLNTEYNPSKQKCNVAIVDCSYMFRLLQNNHHQAVYQTCRKEIILRKICRHVFCFKPQNHRTWICGLWILWIYYIVCLPVCPNRDWIKRVTCVIWSLTIQLYTHWIHINYCSNIQHTLTPSFNCYCRWNTQYIDHTRRHTVSAHHLYYQPRILTLSVNS